MVAPGIVCGCSGGVCVVALGGHAWDTTRYGDTGNERAVRILLECIRVFYANFSERSRQNDQDLHKLSHSTSNSICTHWIEIRRNFIRSFF